MKYVLGAVVDALLPRLCPVCGCSLARGESLMCMRCLAALPRTRMHLRRMHYSRNSPYAAVIRDAKYHSMPGMAREAGRLFALEMQADGAPALADVDVLLPVPMHWTRLMQRGYNQSREVALGISAATGIPVGDNLHAVRRHSTQTRRSADERRLNVQGTIAVRHPRELDGLHVAVVDDVITTGATMTDALRAITAAASPRALSVLALGAVHSDEWTFRD